MILTALVQYKGNTLVVDLPRDRLNLEVKIRSIGIDRLSDKIQIVDDDEKNDVSVKLFGENDIGRHLSLLFNENHTLFEVNKTMQFVAYSVEDIRDDLETNIVHDQYDSPAELIGDIERMTDEVGKQSRIHRGSAVDRYTGHRVGDYLRLPQHGRRLSMHKYKIH